MPVAEKDAVKRYLMPQVNLGEIVLWYPDLSRRDPAPAMVTAVGPLAVSLSLFPAGQSRMTPKDGVRHYSDPEAAKQMGTDGFWGYSALGRSLRGKPGDFQGTATD